MFRALQAFLTNDAPTRAQATGALRTLFITAFWGQVALAGVAWGALLVFFDPQPAVTTLTAQVMLGLAALELPAAYLLGSLSARSGAQADTRAGALSAALLEGILLAAPVWFALFTWLIGSPALYPALLLGSAALFYGLGLLAVGRHAAQAAQAPVRAKAPPKTREVLGADAPTKTVE